MGSARMALRARATLFMPCLTTRSLLQRIACEQKGVDTLSKHILTRARSDGIGILPLRTCRVSDHPMTPKFDLRQHAERDRKSRLLAASAALRALCVTCTVTTCIAVEPPKQR